MQVRGGRKESAVLVPLFISDGVIHVVFTERRHDLRRHPGEISFPGGSRDPGDETLMHTALREACEEIGLPREAVTIAGALLPVGTYVTNYAIYPFVGLIESGLEWVIGEAEVAQVLEFSVDALVAGAGERRMVRRGMAFKTHTYEVDGHVIWGATARIVADLLDRVDKDGLTPFKVPAGG
jgi:8-oxo-dGTP pyrophosphatase MutT (NUDIX family)